MKTVLSSKGQVVLPIPVRRKLGLETGAMLDVSTGDDCIILRLERPCKKASKISVSATTGLPVLRLDETPQLTGAQVKELMKEFP
jgi:AbrB family looped-hinge helix DNA binding protein